MFSYELKLLFKPPTFLLSKMLWLCCPLTMVHKVEVSIGS